MTTTKVTALVTVRQPATDDAPETILLSPTLFTYISASDLAVQLARTIGEEFDPNTHEVLSAPFDTVWMK